MRVDAGGPGRAAFARPFDLCVIGAGFAGIALARRAAGHGLDVALLEAGDDALTEESQALYEGEIAGLDYFPLDVARLRFLGGSSNHWAGWSRALDARDFEAKPWHPLSGWPIGRGDLDPYQPDVDAMLGLIAEAEDPDRPVPWGGGDFEVVRFRWSWPPANFRERYGDELAASERITLGLNANLVDLRLDPGLRRVERAVFRGYGPDDPGFGVEARAYALCCGGIENPRLLLNFTSQMQAGIGNGRDLVGRYFQEHPHFVLADAIWRQPSPQTLIYGPTDRFMAERAVLNFGLRVEVDPEARALAAGSAAGAVACGDPLIGRIAGGLAEAAPGCGPGEDGRPRFDGRLRIACEQALDPDSRVRLGAQTDRFGLRRAALDWRLGERDAHTMREAVTAFAGRLAEADIGRARLRDWLRREPADWPGVALDEVAGKHHMGATRMADDPARGVVDRDCRVHGTDNLYVGGSSVFATGGHANPTYTVVQLALRLGDHIGATLGG